jgi:hypothetical protein
MTEADHKKEIDEGRVVEYSPKPFVFVEDGELGEASERRGLSGQRGNNRAPGLMPAYDARLDRVRARTRPLLKVAIDQSPSPK